MIIGSKIFHKKRCYNSLLWAKEKVNSAPDGSVFLCDIHEHCRGRQNRIWKFDPEQLIITILLKPENLNLVLKKDLPLILNQLNMAITLGILGPLKEFGIELKWANDFVYKNKKVGGLISQALWSGEKIQGIIFGFAININNDAPKLKDQNYYSATSLKQIVNKKIDKKVLFNNILSNLDQFYRKWISKNFDEIYKDWKTSQNYFGKKLKIHQIDGALISGIFQDVLPNGDLLLQTDKDLEVISFFNVLDSVLIK